MIARRYHAWLAQGRPEDLEAELTGILPGLHAHARRLLRSASEADDAVQEAMIELLRCRQSLPPELPLEVVAHRLVYERSLMSARARQRGERRFRALGSVAEPVVTPPHACAGADSPLDAASPGDRALLLAVSSGEPVSSLTRRLGVGRSTLQVRIHRSRVRIRRRMSGLPTSCLERAACVEAQR